MSAALVFKIPPQAPGRAWLVTFVDLILLLLTFFVLMFSMSQPDPATFEPAVKPADIVVELAPAEEPLFARARSYVSQADRQSNEAAYLERALKSAFAQSSALKGIQFRSNAQYLVISLPGEILASGADGKAIAKSVLFDLGGVFANIDNRLAVIGLADQTAESWASAIRRADLVAQALTRTGYDRPIATLARAGATSDAALEIMIMTDRLSEMEQAP